MSKILLLYPNRWGRGITALWIPSHVAVLKSRGHEVRLFDCTFYEGWKNNEVSFNTSNKQYKPSDYELQIVLKKTDVRKDLEETIRRFEPDIIFFAALSSHIHGEGEYVNIQYGHDLLAPLKLPRRTRVIAGGLQPTADPWTVHQRFPSIDYFIRGESEFILADLADRISQEEAFLSTPGLLYRKNGQVVTNPPQAIISDMDRIPAYDYSLFEGQVFLRPYNGKVVRAVDYEMSRGCIYTCAYCVETVIQRYYGFKERNQRGTLKNWRGYLRHKSASRIYEEMGWLHKERRVELFRCQDTNFLTIDKGVLQLLADLLEKSGWDIRLYIETRPDGINEQTVRLLSRLKVDGVGMGIELASENFRENNLYRFSPKEKILRAFQLLRQAGIKRTAYNIIGLPEEDESMILETIRFNQSLDPDNITVAFYSPYLGTEQQAHGSQIQDFNDYEYNVDAQLRTLTKSTRISKEMLEFYKKYFVTLARQGLGNLEALKETEFATIRA